MKKMVSKTFIKRNTFFSHVNIFPLTIQQNNAISMIRNLKLKIVISIFKLKLKN